MSELDDLVAALAQVKHAFESLGIRYFVGGSVASSYHGAPRSTMDIDLVAEMTSEQVTFFVDLVSSEYYASVPAIQDAIKRKSCFNLIHNATSFKVDVFISRGRAFDLDSIRRAVDGELGLETKLTVPLASAEDIIVSKLEWYRLGDEASERQWEDVSRVLRLLGEKADIDYLENATNATGVQDLWHRLKGEVESD